MPVKDATAIVCPECGTRAEEGFSRGLGRCMICLLRVGFDGSEESGEAMSSPVVERLGTYRIERREDATLWELGRGAMGVTYRAVDTSLQRPVALKLIDSEWAKRGAEARERFMREARAAAALRHPNVAAVYHFGIREENGQCFCALELVEGETLETRVRRTGPLDPLTTVEIALQVSSALAAAEMQGLVHRDLKPANLMIVVPAPDSDDAEPVVKVIDFGVAKALAEKPDAMGLTHGGFVGTPAFASPEQFSDAPVDVRSDIYSLGATLWYLLTGHMPFPGANLEQIRASHQLHALPLEQLKAARVPNRLISLLVSMLANEPAARPGVRELTSKLQECRAQIIDRWKTARRVAVTAGLIGIAAFVFFSRWHNRAASQNAAPASISEKSIAALPFENLSKDDANAYFAGGMQDEILTHLAKIADLKVISRTSVMQYKTGADRNLREIGKQLGVAHLLEGSVQRDANRVRVNVQLIDARTDAHLWAETYDRDMADAFSIQSEIAKRIAESLQARLSGREEQALAVKPTNNPEAYDAYLRGLAFDARSWYSPDNVEKAISFYDRAVQLDPSFALAWGRLSRLEGFRYFTGQDTTAARRAAAEQALNNAQKLQPNAPETMLAQAFYQYWILRDYELATETFGRARKLLPNDMDIPSAIASIERRQGRWEQSVAHWQETLALDPRNSAWLTQQAITFMMLRQFPAALKTFDRALDIVPNDPSLIGFKAEIYQAEGDLEQAGRLLAQTASGTSVYQLFLERRYDEAIRLLQVKMAESHSVDLQLTLAFAQQLAGDPTAAKVTAQQAREELEPLCQKDPANPELAVSLSRAYGALGQKAEALKEAERARTLLPSAKDATMGPYYEENLARIQARFGENDRAIAALQHLLTVPYGYFPITPALLRFDPEWDPLRGDPRFDKLCSQKRP